MEGNKGEWRKYHVHDLLASKIRHEDNEKLLSIGKQKEKKPISECNVVAVTLYGTMARILRFFVCFRSISVYGAPRGDQINNYHDKKEKKKGRARKREK